GEGEAVGSGAVGVNGERHAWRLTFSQPVGAGAATLPSPAERLWSADLAAVADDQQIGVRAPQDGAERGDRTQRMRGRVVAAAPQRVGFPNGTVLVAFDEPVFAAEVVRPPETARPADFLAATRRGSPGDGPRSRSRRPGQSVGALVCRGTPAPSRRLACLHQSAFDFCRGWIDLLPLK